MTVKLYVLIYLLFIKSCSSKGIYYNGLSDTNSSFIDPYRPVFRVIDGKPAAIGQFPYQVSFKQLSRSWYINFCGGTIIKDIILLTAAHCFSSEEYLNRYQYAHAGTLATVDKRRPDSIRTGQWRRIIAVSIHRRYSFPHNDIALVKLKKPFIFNENIQPIPYATLDQDYNEECLASGYGFISWETKKMSTQLMYIYIKVQSMQECTVFGRKTRYFVCLETGGAGIGQGDSGGPLVCKNSMDPMDTGKGVVVGVTSGRQMKIPLDFYTRVSSFVEFIEAEDFSRRKRGGLMAVLLIIMMICIGCAGMAMMRR